MFCLSSPCLFRVKNNTRAIGRATMRLIFMLESGYGTTSKRSSLGFHYVECLDLMTGSPVAFKAQTESAKHHSYLSFGHLVPGTTIDVEGKSLLFCSVNILEAYD